MLRISFISFKQWFFRLILVQVKVDRISAVFKSFQTHVAKLVYIAFSQSSRAWPFHKWEVFKIKRQSSQDGNLVRLDEDPSHLAQTQHNCFLQRIQFSTFKWCSSDFVYHFIMSIPRPPAGERTWKIDKNVTNVCTPTFFSFKIQFCFHNYILLFGDKWSFWLKIKNVCPLPKAKIVSPSELVT